MRRYHFTVTGGGSFPFDMLRICEAWPASASDAEAILLSCPTVAPQESVTLATHKELSGTDRQLWALRNWRITSIA